MRKHLSYFALLITVAGILNACQKTILPSTPTQSDNEDVGLSAAVPVIVETSPAILSPVPGKISTNILGYYEGLPAHYKQTSQKYPVIFCFHGGGQYGDGHTHLDTVLSDGIPRLLRDKKFPPSFTVGTKVFSFIVIMPQQVRPAQNYEIAALVNYAKAKYRIDTTRMYFSGFSLGGRQASDYAAYQPRRVAAMTNMGGMMFMNSNYSNKCKVIAAANVAIWQFHAKNDSAWKYTESIRFVNTVNSFNPVTPARLTIFPKDIRRLNHDCWTQASDPSYKENGKNIYEWMLSYRR